VTRPTDYLWDPASEPVPEILELETALRPYRFELKPLEFRGASRWRTVRIAAALVAASVSFLIAGAWLAWRLSQPTPWTVETLAGSPSVERGADEAHNHLAAGARVKTDQQSVARVAVGSIGVADLAPNTEVAVLRDDAGEHRLALRYGTIHARIWARPRFFVVETPFVTAVDLGCIYTMRVDREGAGMLAVGYGEVELASAGRRSLVTAGTAARMDAVTGPGIPYPVMSSPAFQSAVAAADAGKLERPSLDIILRESDIRSTITLWHLMPRVDPVMRGQIYDRLAALSPPPSGVGRAAAVSLDSSALARWETSLRPAWHSEPHDWWDRLLVRVGVRKPALLLRVREIVGRGDGRGLAR
jgi:hypothetical protein